MTDGPQEVVIRATAPYRGIPRTGRVMFSGNTPQPADQPSKTATPGAVKRLMEGSLRVARLIVQNAQKDDDGNNTQGNFILIGSDEDQEFELAPGAGVELLDVDIGEVFVTYIGTVLAANQIVVVRWIAHGAPFVKG
jgi:hypothetical protein